MTHVIYDPQELCLTVSGHAGYGSYGHDLVCAALSVLCYTAEEALTKQWELTCPTVDRSDGEYRISCQPEDEASAGLCRAVMDTVFTGFRLLEEHYPEYVCADILGGEWRNE